MKWRFRRWFSGINRFMGTGMHSACAGMQPVSVVAKAFATMHLWGGVRPAEVLAEPMSEPAPLPLVDSVQAIMVLTLLLILIVAVPWLLRRVSGLTLGLDGRLRVLTAVAVGPRERVVLVEVGQEQLLLGVAPGQVRLLHVLPEPLVTPAPAAGDFKSRLQAAMSRLRTPPR